MENFLQSFRATTEKFLADLGSLLSETVLAFKDSSEAVHTTLTDRMEKIAVTLTQMNDQFKESSMNRNDAEAKERAKIIRDKIQFYWNETLSKRKDFFWKRLRNQKSAELYEIYLEKNFVPRKFRTKLPDNCTERKKQLLGNLVIDRVKHEIIILKNKSSEFKEKYESIDEKLLEKIQDETSDPATITNLKKFWIESYEKEEEKSLTIWNKQEEEMKNLYDKEINEKVDCLTKKQDFDENMNLQNNMDGDQRINDRGRPPSPRPSSPRPYNRRHPSPGPALHRYQPRPFNTHRNFNGSFNRNNNRKFNNNNINFNRINNNRYFKSINAGDDNGNFDRNYQGNYRENYRRYQNGNYNMNHRGNNTGNYTESYHRNDSGNYRRNYNGNNHRNYTGNSDGNYRGYFNRNFHRDFNRDYNGHQGLDTEYDPRNNNTRPPSRRIENPDVERNQDGNFYPQGQSGIRNAQEVRTDPTQQDDNLQSKNE